MEQNARALLAKKVETLQSEYRELMKAHIALQVQYIEEQKQLQDLLEFNRLTFANCLSVAVLYVVNTLKKYPTIRKIGCSLRDFFRSITLQPKI
jgi:hypothetical protein